MTSRLPGMLGVAVVTAVALGGCATLAAPEPGFSDEEWAEYTYAQADARWEYLGLPLDLQPLNAPVVIVASDDYPAKYAECMNDAGFDRYLPDGTIEGSEDSFVVTSDAELIASFGCSTHLALKSQENGMLNAAQREYAYDYYAEVLVPCLIKHNIDLGAVPSREQFDEMLGVWNPYNSVREEDLDRVSSDDELRADCLPVPPGMTNYLSYGFY